MCISRLHWSSFRFYTSLVSSALIPIAFLFATSFALILRLELSCPVCSSPSLRTSPTNRRYEAPTTSLCRIGKHIPRCPDSRRTSLHTTRKWGWFERERRREQQLLYRCYSHLCPRNSRIWKCWNIRGAAFLQIPEGQIRSEQSDSTRSGLSSRFARMYIVLHQKVCGTNS